MSVASGGIYLAASRARKYAITSHLHFGELLLYITIARFTQKTVNTLKILGKLIVYWPITIKFRHASKPQNQKTNYLCCLRFSYLAPY